MHIWILSISGIMVLIVLVDIIIPEGETNKFIKGIFSVVIIISIILPINEYLNKESLIKVFDFSSKYFPDENYIQVIYLDLYEKEENNTLKYLEKNGIKAEKIDICIDPVDKRKILYINVFLNKTVINEKNENINIINEIKLLLSNKYSIKTEDIRVLIW